MQAIEVIVRRDTHVEDVMAVRNDSRSGLEACREGEHITQVNQIEVVSQESLVNLLNNAVILREFLRLDLILRLLKRGHVVLAKVSLNRELLLSL